MITQSNDIFTLDFSVFIDLSGSKPTVKFINASTGPNLNLCKWIFNVLTPNNTAIHTSDFTNPDENGSWTEFEFIEGLPEPGNNIIWSGSGYRFIAEVMDSSGNIFRSEITKDICRPNGNQNGNNLGMGEVEIQVRCDAARLYVEDKTNYSYKKQIQPSNIFQKKFILSYPATDQGTYPLPFIIQDFSNGLIPISYSGPGYIGILESIVDYDLGDFVVLRIKYKFKETFAIQCNIDLCKIMCEYDELIKKAEKECDKELSEKITIINSLVNKAIIGKMQPLCKIDVAAVVEEIKNIGGFTCDCNCGDGINALLNPNIGTGISDCNAVLACFKTIVNGLNPHCLATQQQWQEMDLSQNFQLILNAIGSNCNSCSAPADLIFNVSNKKLRWRSTNNSYQWKVEYKRQADANLSFISTPLPVYIGSNFWEIDLSGIYFEPSQQYVFAVTALCGNLQSNSVLSQAYIPNGCTEVDFNTMTIPNAQINQPYLQNIALTGTGPFTLTGITKPSWMSIAVVGGTVQLSGTPGPADIQSAIDIIFTVNNGCGSKIFTQAIDVSAICIAASISIPDPLPNAVAGQAYAQTYPISGTAPFLMNAPIKPAWMNIAIIGSVLQITGNPVAGDAGSETEVSFKLKNDCGVASYTGGISVNLNCTPVSFSAPNIPEGQVGQAYLYNIELSGTDPFTLTGITKPSWMSIAVVGGTVQLSGTPGPANTGANILVEFTVNNGCGTQTFTQTINVSSACNAVTFIEPVLDDAVVGASYSKNIALSGTAPFTLTGITKPSWMSIAVVGGTVQLSGTPGPANTGTNITVAFTVNNGCGNQGMSQTIDVNTACIGASFTEPTLLNAVAGQPYTQNIALSGTSPFTLSGIIKPAWMNIAVVGSTVQISGTPDESDISNNNDVEFTVSNSCGSQALSQQIDVIYNFNVANASASSTITSVAPAFFTYNIVPNDFPLSSGQSIMGLHTGHSGNITVGISLGTAQGCLKLLINGIEAETINVDNVTNSYVFSTYGSFSGDDIVQIILTDGGVCI